MGRFSFVAKGIFTASAVELRGAPRLRQVSTACGSGRALERRLAGSRRVRPEGPIFNSLVRKGVEQLREKSRSAEGATQVIGRAYQVPALRASRDIPQIHPRPHGRGY